MKILSLLFLFVLCACSSMEDPVELVSYDGFNMKQVSTSELEFDVKMTVQNNLPLAIKIKPSTLDVGFDNQPYGKLVIDQKFKMKARKQTQLLIPAKLELEKGVFLNIMQDFQKDSVAIFLKGNVHAKMLIVSHDVPVSITKVLSPKSINPFLTPH